MPEDTRTLKARFEGEVFMHRVLWSAAKSQHERSTTLDRFGSSSRMAAMLLARLTVEAYANFLLDVFDPESYAQEKTLFRDGVRQKLDHVALKLRTSIDWGQRPFQTLSSLSELRTLLVHAKAHTYSGETLFAEDCDPPFLKPSEVDRSVTPETTDRAMKDVAALCQLLHEHALVVGTERQRMRLFGAEALEGSTQVQTGTTSLA